MCKLPVSGRVNAVQAGAHHGNGRCAGIQRTLVTSGIDAQCQAAGDHQACCGKVACEIDGGLPAGCRRVAASNHRQLWFLQDAQVTVYVEQWRRIGNFPQERRVIGIPTGQDPVAGLCLPFEIALDGTAVRVPECINAAVGQTELLQLSAGGIQHSCRIRKLFQQLVEAGRPYARCMIEGQPVDQGVTMYAAGG